MISDDFLLYLIACIIRGLRCGWERVESATLDMYKIKYSRIYYPWHQKRNRNTGPV